MIEIVCESLMYGNMQNNHYGSQPNRNIMVQIKTMVAPRAIVSLQWTTGEKKTEKKIATVRKPRDYLFCSCVAPRTYQHKHQHGRLSSMNLHHVGHFSTIKMSFLIRLDNGNIDVRRTVQ